MGDNQEGVQQVGCIIMGDIEKAVSEYCDNG